MAVINDAIAGFKRSGMLMKIIWVNIAVFVVLRLLAIVGIFAGSPAFIDDVLMWVEMPSRPEMLISRPWTVVTYMFTHYDLIHILFNMLWLYWFGTLFTMVATQRQMFALYLLGGLGGAAVYLAAYNVLPFFSSTLGMLTGASASVIAIVTASAILMPDFKMNLLFIGGVSLKWIALATIFLVLIGVAGTNVGGELAHLGGILVGAAFAIQLKKGRDITAPINRLLHVLANGLSRSSAAKAQENGPSINRSEHEELNEILEKIRRSGYTSLSPRERDRLFELSRNIKI